MAARAFREKKNNNNNKTSRFNVYINLDNREGARARNK